METRVLTINLAKPLRAELKVRSSLDLAKRIGISPQKLTAIINDEWNYITRDAIERTADYLNLPVEKVFELVPVDFWKPLESSGKCTFLRGSPFEKNNGQDIHIPGADTDATNEVTSFLRGFMSGFTYADHKRETDELIRRARTENCIVIGSVRSNAASEILLSSFFGAEPFNASDDNRSKIPFGFCWPEDAVNPVEQSSLSCSDLANKTTKSQAGITVKGGPYVRADYKDLKSFREEPMKRGKDCGLVFVANSPFGTNRDVKLIVLAGLSGIGTLAAAKALVEDFRYLEPYNGEQYAYGVVESWYSKVAHSERREYKGFRWRFRKGGHGPILIKETKKGNRFNPSGFTAKAGGRRRV